MYQPQKWEPFISDPQKFIDYYKKQAGGEYVEPIPHSGLGNQFGSKVVRIIPLPNTTKNKTEKKHIQPVITSPTEAAVRRAEEQYKRNQAEKERWQHKCKSTKKDSVKPKRTRVDPVKSKRKRKERDLFAGIRK